MVAPSPDRSQSRLRRRRFPFLHRHGWLGVLLLLAFVLSALWTTLLAVIQIVPNTVANVLMRTTEFDFGEFWLLSSADPSIAIPAAVVLASIAIGYGYLSLAMMFPYKLIIRPLSHSPFASRWVLSKKTQSMRSVVVGVGRPNKISDPNIPNKTTHRQRILQLIIKLGCYIKCSSDNALFALPKLIFQTTTLITYLNEGFPLVLIFSYSCLLLINWMLSSYHSAHGRLDPHTTRAILCNSFDLFFAVFAPLQVLLYAYKNFEFDRAAFAVRLETLSSGQFETTARLFADPTQVSLFRLAFQYLQLSSGSSLLIKVVLNILTLFRWLRTLEHLIEHTQRPPANRSSLRSIQPEPRRRERIQNAIIAAIFFFAGSAIFVHSIGAVVTTNHVCKQHEQCKVPSYHWNLGAQYCSCIVFVDRHPGLKTVAEWENPPDTSSNLAALAHTGDLKIIQIINRKVPTLPEELRRCHNLQQLILLYTKIHAIPDWTKEFHHLEYLHIQGDLTTTQLTYLPQDLFHDMPHLSFLHLGCHIKLTTLPDLSHLHKLTYLTFGMLHSITELPSLDSLSNLHRLSIVDLIRLPTMPSVKKLKKLKSFSILSRNPMCCNGFLTQPCNLTDFSCKDRTSEGEPLVQCTTDRISPEDYTHLKSIGGGSMCPGGNPFDLKKNRQSLANTDNACGGIKYKQCRLGIFTGICYPHLMQTLSCLVSTTVTNMRRLEIARRVGEPCNATVEAWLGCSK